MHIFRFRLERQELANFCSSTENGKELKIEKQFKHNLPPKALL